MQVGGGVKRICCLMVLGLLVLPGLPVSSNSRNRAIQRCRALLDPADVFVALFSYLSSSLKYGRLADHLCPSLFTRVYSREQAPF